MDTPQCIHFMIQVWRGRCWVVCSWPSQCKVVFAWVFGVVVALYNNNNAVASRPLVLNTVESFSLESDLNTTSIPSHFGSLVLFAGVSWIPRVPIIDLFSIKLSIQFGSLCNSFFYVSSRSLRSALWIYSTCRKLVMTFWSLEQFSHIFLKKSAASISLILDMVASLLWYFMNAALTPGIAFYGFDALWCFVECSLVFITVKSRAPFHRFVSIVPVFASANLLFHRVNCPC